MKFTHATVTTDHAWLNKPDEQIARYNCFDTRHTAQLAQQLQHSMVAKHQWEVYLREVAPVVPAVLAMSLRGVPIDTDERTRLRRAFRAEVRACDRVICDAAKQPFVDLYESSYGSHKGFKPNSDTQVRRWLFGGDRETQDPGALVEVIKGTTVECLGLKPAGKTDTKMWSVDLPNLIRVVRDLRKMDEPHRALLYALCHRARYTKLDEYLDFDVEDDGRVRPTWKMHGTKSLRLAVSDPALHSWADEMRSMVVAPAGCSFVRADFSAVEARLAAYLSNDRLDIETYERPGRPPYKHHPAWDIHSQMVLECFPELDEPTWATMGTKRELYRNLTKTVRYGTLLYGGEPETAKTKEFCPCPKCADKTPPSLDLTPARKRQIVDRWFARHPNFVRWRNDLTSAFRGPHATHCLKLPISGLYMWFLQPWSNELEREVYNRPIQHGANIIKMRAMRRLHERGVPIIIDHHDALYAEVPDDQVETTRATMVECMTEPVPELGGAQFPVDTASGKTWAELH